MIPKTRTHRLSGFALITLGLTTLGGGCPISFLLPDDGQDTDTCRCDTNIQVEIEARFVTVDNNFLHDVGIDLNTTLQLGAASGAGRSFFPAPFTGDPLGLYLGVPGSPTGDGLAGLTEPSITSPLALLSTNINETQLDSVLAALAARQDAQILNGPKVTLQTGQSTFIMLINEQRFLSDVNATFVDALFNIDPLIPALNTGPAVEFEVRGVEDNTNIVLTLRPSIGGTFNTPDVTGDRPLVQIAGSQTTVRVPDGGTVVIGGVIDTSTGTRTESVIPVLGKLPIINRLFDNRQFVGDDDNLMIFITPRIIND